MAVTPNKIMSRIYLVVLGLFLFSFVLIGKLIYIQFEQGEYYKDLAQKRTVKNFVLAPSRGNIYADDESLLATTVPRYEIRWDAKVPSKENFETHKLPLAKALSELLGGSSASWLRKLNSARNKGQRYVFIARNLTYSQFQEVKKFPLFSLPGLKGGLIVESKLIRENPLGKIAERTIGYERQDPSGNFVRVGLEGAFGQYLKGENGRRLKQKIANGQWKPINDSNEKEPTEGFDVHTTLNVNIQDVTHHALLMQLEEYEAEHGTAVVMETKTGAIKAIANLGRTKEGKYYEKLNYAVGEAHEPGSTFKLMAVMAALEDKVVAPEDLINTQNGVLTFYNKYKVRDSRRGGYGTIPISKAFEVSSNTGIVKMVYDQYKHQPEKFVNRLYNMGVNEKLGLKIKGEAQPKIPHPTDKNWNGISLPWMAFGYGVSLTPLQTLTFYNAVANNGEMVRPQFIKYINYFGSEPVKKFEKEILNPSICSETTLKAVQKMMFNVVDKKWGTAHNIKDPNFSIAGKTGTCQVDYTTEEMQYVSSFVGYFPADNPQYSCIVVIHKPNKAKGYYGAHVAAPVFKKIAKKLYAEVPSKKRVDVEEMLVTNKTVLPEPQELERVPDLKGMAGRDALSLMENLGFKVELKGKGKVKKQSLRPGSPIVKNKPIILELL